MNCSTCQDLLFDYVYGLLDETETSDVREHALACHACGAELTKAKTDQLKLGRAALAIAQVAPFETPSERPVSAITAAPPLPMPQSETPRRRGIRPVTILAWAGALACCLVAAIVLGSRHQQSVAQQETLVANLSRQNGDIEGKLVALEARLVQDQNDLPQHLAKESLQLHVSGPGTVTPGASAGFRVSLRDPVGAPRNGTVDVDFLDAKNQPVARTSVAVNGDAELAIPAELAKKFGPVHLKAVAHADGKEVAAIEETVESQAAGLAAHVAVNKLLFKPGERIQVRALALDRATLKPAPLGTKLGVTLLAENGRPAAPAIELTTVAGMGAGEIALPPNLGEGLYVVETRGPAMNPVHRRVEVLPPVAPPADVLAQDSRIGRGQPIKREVQLYNQDGSPAANQPVVGNAFIGNANAGQANDNRAGNRDFQNNQQNDRNQAPYTLRGNTDNEGRYQIVLPPQNDAQAGRQVWQAELSYGNAKKNRAVVQGDLQLPTSRVVVEFFPEGGRLIAGTPNKVFYRVRAPEDGAAVSARIALDAGKKRIFDSAKETSFGSFELTPDAKETYVLKVLVPKQADVPNPFAGLGIQSDGLLLRGDTVQSGGEPLKIALENRGAQGRHPERLVQVIATCRGNVVFHDRVAVRDAQVPLTIKTPAEGILRVTALEAKDGQLVPLTERLFFRAPSRRLDLKVDADKNAQGVELKIKANDERSRPAACWSLASVVDDRFRGDVPEPSLSAHFLLLSDAPADLDLSELPMVALDGSALSPQKRGELETMLGIFGWRRVGAAANVNPTLMAKEEANRRDADQKAREPQAKAASPSATFFYRVEPSLFELRQRAERKYEIAQNAWIEDARRNRAALEVEQAEIGRRLASARAELEELQRRPRQILETSLGAIALAALALGVVGMAWGLSQMLRRRPAALSFGAACGCLAACLALLVMKPQDATEDRRAAVNERINKVGGDVKPRPMEFARPKTDALRNANVKVALSPLAEAVAMDKDKGMEKADKAAMKREAEQVERARRLADGVPGEQLAQLDQQKQIVMRSFKNLEMQRAAPQAMAQNAPQAGPTNVALVPQRPGSPAPALGGAPGGFGGAPAPAQAPAQAPVAPQDMAKADALKEMKKGLPPAAAVQRPEMAGGGKAAQDAAADKGGLRRLVNPALEAFAKRQAADVKTKFDLNALNRDFAPRLARDVDEIATILWNPALEIPAAGTSLRIDLPAGAARYRVLFFGHTEDGRLGAYDGILSTK